MSAVVPSLTFVTGGARSGKSRFALELARNLGGNSVTFVATAQALDAEMRERIGRHRLERPPAWETLEAPRDPAGALRAARSKVVLLDCLSLLVSNLLLDAPPDAEAVALGAVDALLEAHRERSGHLIVVSNEVGSGVVPPYPLGRAFRDALGRANQRVAGESTAAHLLVSGLPLRLK